ncbi:hypothetical protein KIN20_010742 [Parelaphostrongylus tenuis]|uniref:Uncharacterized protein n=1 Tax=Parelaphostrongylus tenuis TaxID=148309 RepID=A0AAD5MUF1_PARTN|nr:hypothetical protein KIN20_010742 [Parelaphostrongylus tenuis]
MAARSECACCNRAQEHGQFAETHMSSVDGYQSSRDYTLTYHFECLRIQVPLRALMNLATHRERTDVE